MTIDPYIPRFYNSCYKKEIYPTSKDGDLYINL